MNIRFYDQQSGNSGGYPNGYSPNNFASGAESYLCSNQAAMDKAERELEHERNIAPYRTKYDDMPDFVKANYVGPKYGTQEYQDEMNAKYGDRAPNYMQQPGQQQSNSAERYGSFPEPRPYTPGMNGPIQCTKEDGSVDQINVGGFEPQGQVHQNMMNSFATDTIEQKQMRDSEIMPQQYDPYMNQNLGIYQQPMPNMMYDQFGNMIPQQPMMNQQYDQVMMGNMYQQLMPNMMYDQFGNVIPPQSMMGMYQQPMPNTMYDQFGNTIPQQPMMNQPFQYTVGPGNECQAQLQPTTPVQNNQYVQGGTVTYNNGFNPYTGPQQPSSTGNAYLDFINGRRNPYIATVRNPYTGMMMTYNTSPYYQNQFDNELNNILYNMDINHYMENIPYDMLISDEERRLNEQKRRENEAASIYNMTYGLPTMQQYNAYRSEFEQYKNNICDLFSKLHEANNAYFGKEYTKEEDDRVREMYNPFRQMEAAMERNNKQFGIGINYGKMTPQEMKDMKENQKIRDAKILSDIMDREMYYYQPAREKAKAMLYQKIKESHDKLLGVKPGEHYDLKYFLDNGHEIMRNNFINDHLIEARNAKFRQYDSNRFKTNIYNHTKEAQEKGIRPEFLKARPVMAAPGGEYSAEKMAILKNLYDRGGNNMIEIGGVKMYEPPKNKSNPYIRTTSEDPAVEMCGEEMDIMPERMKKFKEAAEVHAEKFRQIQSVYGDRRKKSE